MKIEIWSDVVCPFCYIGKRHLEQALNNFPQLDVEISWKSFELDPNAPIDPDMDIYDLLAKKYGHDREWAIQMNERMTGMASSAGLEFNMDEVKPTNSFKAHQLLHLAGQPEFDLQHELKEALLAAYFTEGKHLGKETVLKDIAVRTGLPEDRVQAVFDDNLYSNEVLADVERAHKLGIQGVPFFLINGKYGLSGAQPVDTFIDAISKISAEADAPLA